MMTVNTNAARAGYSLVVDEKTEKAFYAAEAKRKFRRLSDQWKSERKPHSTLAAMTALPSYHKIMGMGKDALPLIFAQLKSEGDNPDHWFWALASISEANPVPPESRGKMSEMAKAWLAWGRTEGYVD